MPTARRSGSTRRSSWDAPLAAHGMLQTVIGNAWRGDPYPIDMLFLFMANMAWNSAHEPRRDDAHAGRQGRGTGAYTIPKHHLCRRVSIRRRWPTPTWCCRTRPISSARTASRCSTGRSAPPTARRRDPPAGGAAGPRRAAVPGRADRPRRAARAAGLRRCRRRAALSRRLSPTTSCITSARPASARSPAGAARTATSMAAARPTRSARRATSRTAASGITSCRPTQRYYKMANRAYLDCARELGFVADAPSRSCCSSMPRRCSDSASPHRATARSSRRTATASASRRYFDPLPFWYEPFEQAAVDRTATFRCTRSPSGRCACTTWGSQNAWLRQIPAGTACTCIARTAASAGLADDDWVVVESPHGRIKAQIRLMDGVQPRHGLDLERDRQAARRVAPERRCAGGRTRLPAQSPDHRRLLPDARRQALCQCRSGHRPGRLVRPARARRASAPGEPARPSRNSRRSSRRSRRLRPVPLRYGAQFRREAAE